MPSERITLHRTNVDKTELIEQYPKTIVTQVYDFENGKFLNETLNGVTQQLDQNKMKVFKITDFPRIPPENDDTGRFNRVKEAIRANGGGALDLEASTTYTAQYIEILTRMFIIGKGKSTILKQSNNYNGHFIRLETGNEYYYGLFNFWVDGNKDNQTTVNNGIHLEGVDNGYDIRAIIKDIYIQNVSGTGLYYTGKGENVVDNIQTLWCDVDGIYIGCVDSFFNNLSAGGSGRIGIYYAGGNCRVVNAKAYISGRKDLNNGFGFYLVGYAGTFLGCEAQENSGHGFWIDGVSLNILGANSDANGWDSVNNVKVGGKYGFTVRERAKGCVVQGTAYDFHSLNKDEEVVQRSALIMFGGTNNKIEIYSYGQELAGIDASVKNYALTNDIHVTHLTKGGAFYEYKSREDNGSYTPIVDSTRFTIDATGQYARQGNIAHVSAKLTVTALNTNVGVSGFAIKLPIAGKVGLLHQFLTIQARNLVSQTTYTLQGRIYGEYVQILDETGAYLQTDKLLVGSEIYVNGTYLID